ncbi:hypothetical protein SLEP1_g46384 [Rubroshorea leprosula]|uniref:C2 DOCK-type domain-containing protein n=1 Tax=Rubroshorea leprosula TaxID=152421 RepID=A0AAV5LPP2_9ROSI|nr:hypothetical protein SLEP1_g46384 [Rubroshorea leprosula]
MPCRESFAWAIVPLFDNSIGAASGGSASPSSPFAPSMSGSSSHEGVLESVAKITLDGKMVAIPSGFLMMRKMHLEMETLMEIQISMLVIFSILTVSLSWKRNLFVRVELRKDDADVRRQTLEAMHPREPGLSLQKWAHTQVAVGAWMACYHDEIKVSLPAVWAPLHELIFTLFHVDLQMKLEVPKPVVIGYAALPLSTHAQYATAFM